MHLNILACASDDFQKTFKNLKKCVILKIRKKFIIAKMQVFGVFPSRLDLTVTTALQIDQKCTQNHFFSKKVDFVFFT